MVVMMAMTAVVRMAMTMTSEPVVGGCVVASKKKQDKSLRVSVVEEYAGDMHYDTVL
jgi:hypothetical protein